jgi:hypothetical protein
VLSVSTADLGFPPNQDCVSPGDGLYLAYFKGLQLDAPRTIGLEITITPVDSAAGIASPVVVGHPGIERLEIVVEHRPPQLSKYFEHLFMVRGWCHPFSLTVLISPV